MSERRRRAGVSGVGTGVFVAVVGGLAVAAYVERCEFGHCTTNLVVTTVDGEWFELSGSWEVPLRLENVGSHPATNCVLGTQGGVVQFSVPEAGAWRQAVHLNPTTEVGLSTADDLPYVRVTISCDNFWYDQVEYVGVTDI